MKTPIGLVATGVGQRLDIWDLETRGIILSSNRTIKAPISLRDLRFIVRRSIKPGSRVEDIM